MVADRGGGHPIQLGTHHAKRLLLKVIFPKPVPCRRISPLAILLRLFASAIASHRLCGLSEPFAPGQPLYCCFKDTDALFQ